MKVASALTAKALAGRRVLVRVNMDVARPTRQSLRLRAALPTLEFLLRRRARPILMGHRGRPHAKDMSLSVAPAARIIGNLLGVEIPYIENLRFSAGEAKNDRAFARRLARGADIYVNDDFATSHRAAASLVAITEFLPSYAGLLVEREVRELSRARDEAERPFVCIMGGAKLDKKISAIKKLARTADRFLLGSSVNYPREALPIGIHITMPRDYVWAGEARLDIGPETIREYARIIKNARTVAWNGPVGLAEEKAYAGGTQAIAEAIIKSKAHSVVGGGDTADYLSRAKLIDKFDFISTGGGAMLAFLAGETMPALEALDKNG